MKEHTLIMGELRPQIPLIQGGMGVGISLSGLSGAVAKAGGIGLISTAQIGFQKPEFSKNPIETNLRTIPEELERARRIAPDGILGFNIMTATRQYEAYVRAAVEAGADLIVSGAGLPVKLPELTAGSRTKIAPIVSSEKAAAVICKLWDRHYHTAPDLLIAEGPLAGGHLGFKREQLEPEEEKQKSIRQFEHGIGRIKELAEDYGRRYGKKIPVVTAGGIYDHSDVRYHLEVLGADGVQIATRFVTTEECDAPTAYKQAYLRAGEKDLVITDSPVGMPGRAIQNDFLRKRQQGRKPVKNCFRCLEGCDPARVPYCITEALVHAARGEIEEALLFCGAKAYRAEQIETVPEVVRELFPEFT